MVKAGATIIETNERGFILVEMIVCLALTAMMVGVCLPIINQVRLEQRIIGNRTDIQHYLYNQIQLIDHNTLPMTHVAEIDNVVITLNFYDQDDLIVGQGVWQNAKDQSEQVYVYFKNQN